MYLTSRFWRTIFCINCATSGREASAVTVASDEVCNGSLRLASNRSTPSRLRLSAASEPLTKRTAWLSESARARSRISEVRITAVPNTVSRNSAATP